jgi:phosphoribosyl 1,2-cyclic phosphate phosphodiesterase
MANLYFEDCLGEATESVSRSSSRGVMRITFLGTGTSNGIPVIGCPCVVCASPDPRDKRSRTSALVEAGGKRLLIDTAPELRLQAVANGISCVDAVLYTHAHADHVAGFDDLRSFNFINQAVLDVHADRLTSDLIRERYAYAFENPFPFFGGKPDLDLRVFDGPFVAAGVDVVPFEVGHGRWTVTGFRFDRLVYLTDAKVVPDAAIDAMRGAEVLVINALRDHPHPVHLSIPEALEIINEVRPRRAYLTHLSHDVGHAELSRRLPDNVHVAYDGLTVELT